jgi:colanic acid biosynthesis glycosyl transferase WcaI
MNVLLLNQCFYPDVVSTAQHLTDLAVELANNGHHVTVIAGDRGYDNSANRFPRRENWKGIRIIRIPSLALGKSSRLRRALNFASFLAICSLRLLLLPRFDVVVGLTSPPLISLLGALFVRVKGGKFFFWVMDLNPDEAIAAGWLKRDSLPAKFLSYCLDYSLRHSEKVIVLDRFMKQRIIDKGIAEEKLAVIAPWSHNYAVTYDTAGRLAFRSQHGLAEKFVVMYSGNHSPCHPLNTLLAAALKLSPRPDVAFCFIGGGSEHEKVKEYAQRHQLANILVLPYQPLDQLGASLSAADLHVVVMGDGFTGIVHPCKIYNILEIGAPVLYIGPADSHVVDVISQMEEADLMCSARHGEIETVAKYLTGAAERMIGTRSPSAIKISSHFSKTNVLPQMIEILGSVSKGPLTNNTIVSETATQSLF